jgi:hypothetical protein
MNIESGPNLAMQNVLYPIGFGTTTMLKGIRLPDEFLFEGLSNLISTCTFCLCAAGFEIFRNAWVKRKINKGFCLLL